MNQTAYLFLITLAAATNEKTFEKSFTKTILPKLVVFQRNVSGTSQSLSKGADGQGRTIYLLRIEPDFFSGSDPHLGSALGVLLDTMKTKLGTRATATFIASVEAEIPT